MQKAMVLQLLLVYDILFDTSTTPATIGGAAGTKAGSMCAAACSALNPWNLDAATFLPIAQATTAMTVAECTGF